MIPVRLFSLLCAMLMVMASCAPLSIYHREGVAVSRMQSELLSCEISALADVPVNNQIRQEPPVYIPSRRRCDSKGRCYTTGGYFERGEIYTVDVNANLRGRAEQQCMANLGYAPVTIPNCPNSVFRAVPKRSTELLPRLTEQSCAVRYQDNSWQIVNHAK